MNKILTALLAGLAIADFGGDFTKSNQKAGKVSIPTWENEMLQVRLTKPDADRGQGIRISVRGQALGELAQANHGFGKLEFHLKLGRLLQKIAGDKFTVSYNDAPRGQGGGYPVLYVNTAQAQSATAQAEDTTVLVKEAKAVGIPVDKIMTFLESGNYVGLKAAISLYTATTDTDTEPVSDDTVDSDGDSAFDSEP